MPFGSAIPLLHRFLEPVVGKFRIGRPGLPFLADRLADRRRVAVEVPDEVQVRASGPVVGLRRGESEKAGQLGQVEVMEDGAVKEEHGAFTALGIPGKFPPFEGEVGVALQRHGLAGDPGKGPSLAFQDP